MIGKLAVAAATAAANPQATLGAAAVVFAGGGQAEADTTPLAGAGTCLADLPITPATAANLPSLDDEQVKVAREIIRVGRALRVSDHGLRVAIATAMQESTLRNLDHGHASSEGVFQQIRAWGSSVDRQNVTKSATMFFTGGPQGQPGLLDIEGWEVMPVWQAAQSVQRSAFPTAYARWETLAEQVVAQLAGGVVAGELACPEREEDPDHHNQEPGASTAAVACSIGGQGDIVEAPGGVPIRVCAVGPFVVDTTIAQAVAALLADSRAAGLDIGGSGGRSNAVQRRLYAQNCGNGSRRCSRPTAKPGTSQHEWYLALDLTCDGGSAFAFGRSRCYPWMVRHAVKYGLRQLPSERWHFSTTGR